MNHDEFDIRRAHSLAVCSGLAYGAVRGQCVDGREVLAVSERGEACLIDDHGYTVLAFRGTSNARDWEFDAKCLLTPWQPFAGTVHYGFASRLADLWSWIVFRGIDPTRPLWITGHSLGGALATLASARFASTTAHVLAPVYTFGSPRVGNACFQNNYLPTQYRVVDDVDLIPHVPAAWKYRHVGQAVVVSAEGVQLGQTWLQALAAMVIRCSDKGVITSLAEELADHGIANYVEALARHITQDAAPDRRHAA